MKTHAKKSATTTTTSAPTLAGRPFFQKADRRNFFEQARQAALAPGKSEIVGREPGLPQSLATTSALPIVLNISTGKRMPEAFRRILEVRQLPDGSIMVSRRDHKLLPVKKQVAAEPFVAPQPRTDTNSATVQPAARGAESSAKPNDKPAPGPSAAPIKTTELATAEGTPAAIPTAPKSPHEDPDFQKVIAQTRQAKQTQKAHQEPEAKNLAVAKSAHLPEADQKAYNDRKQHLQLIGKTADNTKNAQQKFTAAQFKMALQTELDRLGEKLPHSEADTKRFKREKPLEGIKNNVKRQVESENQKVASPIATEAKRAEPPASGIAPIKPASLAAEPTGAQPRSISPVAAAPKPMTDPEISLEKDRRSLDELMEQNHNTEEQFADSKEPKFQQALKTKKDAQAQADAAPQVYRAKEQAIIKGAQQTARQSAGAGFGLMHSLRNTAFGNVFTKQTNHDKSDKDEQKRIKGELETIYNGTKKKVDEIFTALGTYVEETFEKESTEAKTAFEKRVEDQLDDIHGLGVRDFFFGEDTEAIETVFAAEKQKFIDAMDSTLGKISERVANDLNEAVACIHLGQSNAETFYNGLDTKQQELVSEAMTTYRLQFANLESSVDEKQKELASSLADSYQKNVGALRQTFDKINEEARKTWIERAADFIKEVALTIYRLGELLVTVLVRVAHVIGDILAHPIRFLENLAAGIKQGFATFAGDFDSYLIEGFFSWLKGKVGGAGIKLPAKLDTAGLFGLALQVIGLTYDNFRDIAISKLGAPVVAAIEKGVEGAQEVYKLIQLAREDVGAFWVHIKEVLANTVDEIFEKIKQTVLYETIKKVLAYIVTLFNPAGAFIKAAQAIYAGIQFLMNNIERIVALVNAFLDGVEMAVQGNVSGIAAKVIFGLKNAIVLGIDFLAKLLGLGNLSEKVHAIIKQLRTPVDRALGFVVDKLLKPVVRFIQGGNTPGERVSNALAAAVPIVNRFAGRPVARAVLMPLLAAIKGRYQLSLLEVVPTELGVWAVKAAASPPQQQNTQAQVEDAAAPAAATVSTTLLRTGQWVRNLATQKVEKIITTNDDPTHFRRGQARPALASFATRTEAGSVSNYSMTEEKVKWELSTFSHNSNFVTDGGINAAFILKPNHQGSVAIRATFYRDPSTRPSLAGRLTALQKGAPTGMFFSEATAAEEAVFGYATHANGKALIPLTNYSEDHIKPVAQHWNSSGNATTQAARETWNGMASNFALISSRLNSSRGSGGVNYTPAVLLSFRGPGDPP
ncbi:hypothetical protein [Hymenobacter sp. GOD-10R]|uniref:hypothetical protein n=1 Tax=Hymenobacter sp. GOD-10R TaxID=3093922 RepID=UPI002D7989C4|nr:hypothetical protein [Hymenobacter sp. GOD-10R]WRQ30108.1 hypothetical protein SD425_07520 [Hymenobacter sp. GOD-10R]